MLNELEQKIRKAIPNLQQVIDGYVCSKEVQLNHVLEYWRKTTNVVTSTKFKNELHHIILNWNLKSNLLSDQSEELIKYLMNYERELDSRNRKFL